MERNEVTLRLDSSGERLHRRGYRLATAKAPLRETLAAVESREIAQALKAKKDDVRKSAVAAVRSQDYPGRVRIFLGVGPSDDGTESVATYHGFSGEFPRRMRAMLKALEQAYRVPVDLEFVIDEQKFHIEQLEAYIATG